MYGVFNQKIISRNILPNIFVNNGEYKKKKNKVREKEISQVFH